MMRQKIRIILAWIGVIVLALLSLTFVAIKDGYMPTPSFLMKHPAPPPTPAATRDGLWLQDVNYLGNQLPYLHVNPYFKISEAEFRKNITQLADDVPNLTEEQIIVRMMQIIASIGDGHTRAYPDFDPLNYPSLPLEMRWVDDGLVIVGASPEYEQALGTKVIMVGGHPIDEVNGAVKTLIAADNEMEILNNSPTYIAMPSLLYGLDLIPQNDQVTFTFESQDGSRFDLDLHPTSQTETPTSIYEKLGVPHPLYEQDRKSFYWVQYLPDANIVYVQYNVCAEDKNKPFESFKEEVFSLIDGSPNSRLVLDLRFNGGGNESVLNPFINAIRARPSFNTKGNLYVIIGRGTYSSALQNAITLKQDTNAILIGEPTGGKPNHYGEVHYFNLPNVGLLIQYSTRYWLNYPGSNPLTLEPDIAVAVTIADLYAGRDLVLETIIQQR